MKLTKRIALFLIAGILITTLPSCDKLFGSGLTDAEIAEGLKEALKVGTDSSTQRLHKTDGYNNDALIRIILPDEAQAVVSTLNTVVGPSVVDALVVKINRAAEEAAIEAKPIFVDAITSMTITDAVGILKGNEDAATQYLKSKTYTSLFNAFQPKINTTLTSVGAQQAWTTVIGTYNQIPFVNDIPDNLSVHTTNKALDGLFVYVAKQEKEIRTNASARINDLLRKVFGS